MLTPLIATVPALTRFAAIDRPGGSIERGHAPLSCYGWYRDCFTVHNRVWFGSTGDGLRPRILATIRKIPRGRVSTYGAVARAAGFPGAARQVVRALHSSLDLPWHRVLGAGGEIKLRGDSAIEQRLRLEAEGVTFRRRRVDMSRHEFRFTGVKRRVKGSKR